MLVNERALGKIEAVIKRKIGKLEISVSCSDNTEHQFSSVKTLTKYENPVRSRIQAIHFWAVKDGDWTKQARVSLSSGSHRTLDIEVKSTQATAPSVCDELEEICEGMRVWYWRLYKIDFVMLLFGGFFLLWFVANVWVRIKRGTMVLEGVNSDESAGLIVALGIIVVGSAIHFLRGWLFPRFTVLVGQEIGRHKVLEKIQWGIAVTFVVSLVASAVVALMT